MKTTVDIGDELLVRPKRHAKETGRPLRALVEDGLRLVLPTPGERAPYRLPDCRVGNAAATDPLASLSWAETSGPHIRWSGHPVIAEWHKGYGSYHHALGKSTIACQSGNPNLFQ